MLLFISLFIFKSWWLSLLIAALFLLVIFVFIRRRIETSRRNQVRLEVKIAERTKEIRLQKTKIEEQKRLLEEEKHKVEEQQALLQKEKDRTEQWLLNTLPSQVVIELKRNGKVKAQAFKQVSIMFTDVVGFTRISESMAPSRIVSKLDILFQKFDEIIQANNLEKIKTIGDAYMVVGGLPTYRPDHAEAIAEMALAMQREISKFKRGDDTTFRLRIGINTGAVVAGVIGIRKFIYDLWGDAVNIASRMESHGLAGGIQVTESTYELLKDKYSFWHRGKIFIKGRGEMDTYMLLDSKSQISSAEVIDIQTLNIAS